MALEQQILSLNFGPGVDTKTNPKMVVNGKLTRLENGVFTEAKDILKRNGYDSLNLTTITGDTIVNPQMVKALGPILTCTGASAATGINYIYSYDEDQFAWQQVNTYQSVGVEINPLLSAGSWRNYQDMVSIGNIGLFIDANRDASQFQPGDPPFIQNGPIFAYVVDLDSNKVLVSQDLTFIAIANPITVRQAKCVIIGGNTLAIVGLGGQLAALYTVSPSGNTFVFNPPVLIVGVASLLIANSALPISDMPSVYWSFDVVGTTTGAVLAYCYTMGGGPQGIRALEFNSSGTILNTYTDATHTHAFPITLIYDPVMDYLWMYWIDSAVPTAESIYYAVLTSSLATVLAPTLIVTNAPQTPVQFVSHLLPLPLTGTTQKLYFVVLYQVVTAIATDIPVLVTVDASSTGVAGNYFALLNEIFPHSRVFTYNGQQYAWFCYYSNIQSQLFLFNFNSMDWAAKGVVDEGVIYLNGDLQFNFTANVTVRGTHALLPTGKVIEYPRETTGLADIQSQSVILNANFADKNAYQALVAGNTLIFNGGIPKVFDGQNATELNFNTFPELIGFTQSATGGNIAGGFTYEYFCVYQWTDRYGNLYRSAPSPGTQVVVPAGTNTNFITVYFTGLNVTDKVFSFNPLIRFNSQYLVYRTTGNGTTPFLIQITDIQNSGGFGNFLTVNDVFSDSVIIGGDILYTFGGIVDNTAPPPFLIAAVHNDRLQVVNSESPNEVWYSKSITPGIGVSMSDLFLFNVETRNGPVTGLQGMDEKFVLFTDLRPYFVIGDGPNDTGNGSTLSVPQVMPAGTGCAQDKSIVLLPNGILRMTEKGFYLMDRGLNDQYIGAEVEQYNSQNYTSGLLKPSTTQCILLTDSGLTLVYDYFFNQWGTFTNHTGVGADIWDGLYTYARTDGSIYNENLNSFLDDTVSYALLAEMRDLKFSAVQGFQRVRRYNILGDYLIANTTHGLDISFALDFSQSFTALNTYYFGDKPNYYQFQAFPSFQKCDSMSILFQEVVTPGISGEFCSINDITLEVGIKKGLNKLPAAQQVG